MQELKVISNHLDDLSTLASLGERNFVEENYAEAVKFFRKPAEEGNARAQYVLAVCYFHGEGLK